MLIHQEDPAMGQQDPSHTGWKEPHGTPLGAAGLHWAGRGSGHSFLANESVQERVLKGALK